MLFYFLLLSSSCLFNYKNLGSSLFQVGKPNLQFPAMVVIFPVKHKPRQRHTNAHNQKRMETDADTDAG
jgi:hypothetical protein